MSEAKGSPQKPQDESRRTFLQAVAAAVISAQTGEQPPAPIFIPHPEVPQTTPAEQLPFSRTYTKEQKDRLRILVADQKNYVTEGKFANVSDTTRGEALREIGERYGGLVSTVLAQNGLALDQGLQESLLGLMLIESKGNPREDNGQARGLCQVTATALSEVAKVMPTVWDKNMYDPADNILVAAKYLEILTQRYEKPELALWAYHIGGGRVWRGIKEHLIGQGIPREELENEIGALPVENQNAPIIQKYSEKLSLPSLIDSPAVQAVLGGNYQGSEYEGALHYVPRVIAGSTLIASAQKSR